MLHHITRSAVGAVLALATVQAAMAADIPVKARPAPVAVFTWTGCYVGGHAGWLRGDTEWRASAPQPPFVVDQTVKFNEFTGGGLVGCNLQYGQWVFGVEGDASYARVDKFGLVDTVNQDEIFRTRFDWYGTVRGRVGITFNRALLYGTGGVAIARIRNDYENYVDATRTVLESRNDSRTGLGWVAGGGLDYAITDNWVVGVEGLFYSFDKKIVFWPAFFGFTETAQTQFAVVRGRLIYKFGGIAGVP